MIEHSDYKLIFEGFLKEYSSNSEPLAVNFRELVNKKFQDRATHFIHTYPAKLIPNIPYFFLNNSYFVTKDDAVLDPFSGSGTVLLEAKLAGLRPYGSDSNPIARLISRVKTKEFKVSLLEETLFQLKENFTTCQTTSRDYPDVVNLNYWFLPHVKKQLNIIREQLAVIEEENYKEFFLVCFSNCVKKVSLADSRVSVPVRIKSDLTKNKKKLKDLEGVNVFEKFIEISETNIRRYRNKEKLINTGHNGIIISDDARDLRLESNSIELIITSPPYAGAQKYIRASSLSLGWTELGKAKDLKFLDQKNIGRENYIKNDYLTLVKTGVKEADLLLQKIHKINPLRAHIAANYLLEMTEAIKESIRVLKPNKHIVLVAANNVVCGMEFKTQEYLRQIAEENGMVTICRLIDDIKSYGLMTKRNKTANIITCEWILILKKVL